VYLGCTAAASRVLRGPARVAAAGALVAVSTIMVFSGWAAVLAILTAGTAAALYRRPAPSAPIRAARRHLALAAHPRKAARRTARPAPDLRPPCRAA